MAGQDAVLWSAQELEFAEAESRLYHGGMYRLWQDGCPVGVCNLYRYTADKVIVKELLTEPEVCAEQLVKQICSGFEGGSIEFRLHPLLHMGAPFGKRTGISAVYFGLSDGIERKAKKELGIDGDNLSCTRI